MHDDEEEIELGPYTGLHRVYDWLPYTHQRIKRILKEKYNARLENIWQGYKANRRWGYVEIYQIISNADDSVICRQTTLDALRKYFASKDYPLYDEKSQCNQTLRSKGAEAFMAALKAAEAKNSQRKSRAVSIDQNIDS